jgi:hypothetical protein
MLAPPLEDADADTEPCAVEAVRVLAEEPANIVVLVVVIK